MKALRFSLLVASCVLFGVGLLGCQTQTPLVAQTANAGEDITTNVPPVSTTAAPERKLVAEASFAAVEGFLNSLVEDETGVSSLGYLSRSLQASVNSGLPINNLLVLQEPFTSYGLLRDEAIQQDQLAFVPVNLTSEQEFRKTFVIASDPSQPAIQTVISYNRQPEEITPELAAADQTVVRYFLALSADDLETALALSSENDNETVRQDLTRQIEAVTGFYPASLFMVDASPERVIYRANVWIEAAGAAPGDWLPGLNERYIELSAAADGWNIVQITRMQLPVD